MPWVATGREHEDEFRPDFHDRLARNWPEPREQLHAGGWRATRCLAGELGVAPGQRVLDLCCGEGGTAVWLARTLGVRVTGVDIIGEAVALARQRAEREGVGHLASFVQGNIFSLPLVSRGFDVVMGQDPDGFAHGERLLAFQEGFRVMRPGGVFGIQHWVPGVGALASVKEAFDRVNVAAGFPSHRDVNADAYRQAMEEAGLTGIRTVDKSPMYHAHLEAIRDLFHSRGEEPDAWTATCLELSGRHPFGVALFGRKP